MTEFYQVGGWQSHFRDWNDVKRAGGELLQDARSGTLRLVLGVLHSGASYILVPKTSGFHPYRKQRTYPPSKYASLSPIEFASSLALDETLKSLNPKRWSDNYDTSPANKRYGGSSEERYSIPSVITAALLTKPHAPTDQDFLRRQSHAGRQRSFFEQSRVLFGFVQGGIDSRAINSYTVGRNPKRIEHEPEIVLYFATRTPVLESDRVAHRERDALIFRDYGWAVLNGRTGKLGQWTSLPVEGILSNNDQPEAFRGAPAEELPLEDVTEKVQAFFQSITSPQDTKDTQRPLVIVTCEAQEQLRGLRKLGIAVDNWEIGLTTLFDAERPVYRDEEQRRQTDRSRSRSPSPSKPSSLSRSGHGWGQSRQRSPSSKSKGRDSPPLSSSRRAERRPRNATSERPVYVVDTKDLWEILPGVGFRGRDGQSELRKMALKLGIPVALDTWCAGHDVETIYTIWTLLSGSASVDVRGAQIAKLIEESKYMSKDLDDRDSGDVDALRHAEESADLEYAMGAGAVEAPAPRPKSPAYDPYAEFDDGFDPYDED